MADAERKRSFAVIKSISIQFVPAKQVGLDLNTIFGNVMAFWNSQGIKLSSREDPTWVADWVSGASRVQHRKCVFPNVVRIVSRGTAAIHRKYQSSDVNKSISKSIIDQNAHRWFVAKLQFG